MQDGNGNYQKAFPLFGMGTGITKKLSHYLGRERETPKSLPAVLEREFKAFPLGNIREQEFPLMPGHHLTLHVYIITVTSGYEIPPKGLKVAGYSSCSPSTLHLLPLHLLPLHLLPLHLLPLHLLSMHLLPLHLLPLHLLSLLFLFSCPHSPLSRLQ